jgi:prenyltransferase beta subunit
MSPRISLFVMLLAPAIAAGQTAEETKATIRFVQSLQQPDGGFLPSPSTKAVVTKPASSLRATSSAIRALKYFGGDLANKEKVATFVESCFDKKGGGYADAPGGKTDVFLTAVGIMAAAELKLKDDPYIKKALTYLEKNAKTFEDMRIGAAGFEAANAMNLAENAAVQAWIGRVGSMRNADGSYGKPEGDARMTASAVALLLRIRLLKFDPDGAQKILNILQRGQREDGGFGAAETKTSDLETTYRVMRAFHLLNEKPKDVAKLRGYLGNCRNADGGYGVAPGQPSSVSGVYFASIILHWLK